MIYRCYDCEGFFDEDNGSMTYDKYFEGFPIPIKIDILVFKCKGCLSAKSRKAIERIQLEKK